MSVDMLEADPRAAGTPHRKAHLGSTGSDPLMRLGPKIYSDREVIRDQLTNLCEHGRLVLEVVRDAGFFNLCHHLILIQMALERIVSHMSSAANYGWACSTLLDHFVRSCFDIRRYEDSLLLTPTRSQPASSSDVEVELWLELVKRLALEIPALWVAMCNCAVARVRETLISLDESNAVSSFLTGGVTRNSGGG